ncbi:MBL fold metallo-hydrolase [Mycolicibacterium litorale]|uniref:MBL fold metallo-hydrolase n=1 Tax=Mycolicibacterium litorale TaxID=758802 RepID=UPI003CF37975
MSAAVPDTEVVLQNGDFRVERLITAGTFELDGGSWQVDNNVWLVGDGHDVVIIDAAHDADKIVSALSGRNVTAVVCTHGHNDHVNAAADLAFAVHAPVLLHPGDDKLWKSVHPDFAYVWLHDEQRIGFAGIELSIIHTPGHSPGSVCAYAPELQTLFSGDTLFCGGPGATGRSYSDFPTITRSIQERVLTLPPETEVLTGHGDSTSVGGESPHLEDWIARGY